MIIDIPENIDWVTGMAIDDWNDEESIKIDGKIFIVPKVAAYLFAKLDCQVKDSKNQVEMLRKALNVLHDEVMTYRQQKSAQAKMF